MESSKKRARKQNKINKLKALVDLAGMEAPAEDSVDPDSPASKKLRKTSEENGMDSEEYKKLQLEKHKINTRRKVPRVILKTSGQQASLSLRVDERVPILLTDVQHLLMNALLGDRSPYLPLRWCHLERSKGISHTAVLVVEGVSLYDFSNWETVLKMSDRFNNAIEVITPTLYGGSVIDELALVPAADLDTENLIKEHGSVDVAMETKKNTMTMMRAVFPVVEGLRPQLLSDATEDVFSRTRLMLSAWQLIEENYPVPVKGKLKTQYAGYVMTSDRYESATCSSPLFGLDCEMCRTTRGFELTRATLVNENYETVYDNYVKPDNEIVDYMTQFSGITAKTLSDVKTHLTDVQKDLKNLLPSNAILVGQSLNFDLHALKMMHPYVIDTSVIYNTTGEKNRKTKLKQLAKQFLSKNIQNRAEGHCSVEDAVTSLNLVKLKLKKNITFGDAILKGKNKAIETYEHLKSKKSERVLNIFSKIVPNNKSCLIVGSDNVTDAYGEFLKSFNSNDDKSKLKIVTENNNTSIVDTACKISKDYNLTFAHINIPKDDLPNETTFVNLNNWIDNLWKSVQSKCLLLVIFSGSEVCNGVMFIDLKS